MIFRRFSERMGYKPIKAELQIESIDGDLRNTLWNVLYMYYIERDKEQWIDNSDFKIFYHIIWHNFFKKPIDSLTRVPTVVEKIRDWFFKACWWEVYDFLEFIPGCNEDRISEEFRKTCNHALEKEMAGYRFVDKLISPITNENELGEIEKAIENTKQTKLFGVHEHLKTALAKLSHRKIPDYRNSIKESISAVESICRIISEDPKAELGQALKKLEDKGIEIHAALKKGFSSIYGYTSDEGGIRHAMLEESKLEFEDAQYMLITCSAFTNYLIVKAQKAGIKIQ